MSSTALNMISMVTLMKSLKRSAKNQNRNNRVRTERSCVQHQRLETHGTPQPNGFGMGRIIGYEIVKHRNDQGKKMKVVGTGYHPRRDGRDSNYLIARCLIVLICSILCTAGVHAEVYNYLCKVCIFPNRVEAGECDVGDGKSYPLRVDENRKILEWRGKKYSIAVAEDGGCAKYGWHAEGNGTSFDFCTATQGYGGISDKEGETRVECCNQGGKCAGK